MTLLVYEQIGIPRGRLFAQAEVLAAMEALCSAGPEGVAALGQPLAGALAPALAGAAANASDADTRFQAFSHTFVLLRPG